MKAGEFRQLLHDPELKRGELEEKSGDVVVGNLLQHADKLKLFTSVEVGNSAAVILLIHMHQPCSKVNNAVCL